MKGHPPLYGGHARHAATLVTPRAAWRAAWAAAALTVVVTIWSLSELGHLIEQGNPDADRLDWREVAGRAVKHAEHLPRLPHLPGSGAAAGGGRPGGWRRGGAPMYGAGNGRTAAAPAADRARPSLLCALRRG